ncbi:MAG: biotin transporter BioY [Eggerthellaceae bacterium]
MESTHLMSHRTSRTRSIAFVGLSIAIMAVCAWVTIPFGPVPFTLQTFAMTFAILVLTPREALSAIAGYLVLGAVGLPVFSGMRGGIGMLAGPTGGFLWGFFIAAFAAIAVLELSRRMRDKNSLEEDTARSNRGFVAEGENSVLSWIKGCGVELIAAVAFIVVAYFCGWLQFMFVAGVGPLESFLVTIAPFVLVDAAKIVAAVIAAQAVNRVVR